MGSRLSRRVAGVENIDIQTNSNYHFPPKTGNYFSSHFFIAGERFDTPHPDGYLFGENTELKFLGNRPVQFPYLTPAPKEPVQTLRSLVNIRKDSLRLVRYKDGPDGPTGPVYGVEFIFDADAEVAITVCCQAREELTSGMPVYSPNSPTFLAETVLYRRGVNQQFSHPSFRIDFTQWTPEELHFDLDRGLFPMVLQAVVDGAGESSGHAHVMLAAFDRNVDGSFSVKPLKQKQIVDGVTYLLQEIYGIENRTSLETKMEDEETSGKSSECVVCLADLRDTLILPCRHLCLCSVCADTLRYQANSCPICRLPFRALLQIRALRKTPVAFGPVLPLTTQRRRQAQKNADPVLPGYERVSLLEALNGTAPPFPSGPQTLRQELNKGGACKSPDRAPCSAAPIQEEEDEKLCEAAGIRLRPIFPRGPTPNGADVPQGTTVVGTDVLQQSHREASWLMSTDRNSPNKSQALNDLPGMSTSPPPTRPVLHLHLDGSSLTSPTL